MKTGTRAELKSVSDIGYPPTCDGNRIAFNVTVDYRHSVYIIIYI